MNNKDMGTESIYKLLLRLAIPTVLAQIVNLLYNMVDRVFVGRIPMEGSMALAGLGVAFPVVMLVAAFAAMVGMGGAPRAAIFMGRKENDKAEKILGNSVTLLVIFAVILTGVFLLFKDSILMVFGASEQTLPYASQYLSVYLIGTIFVQFTLGLNMFIISQGFAKTGMLTVCIGAALNIVLDPIFIFTFDMGVVGAAVATVIAQGVSAIWVLRFLLGNKTILKIRKENLSLRKDVSLPILQLGASPFVMQSTECLIQLVFNNSMLHYGGDLYVALMSILFSVMQLVWLPIQGLSQGAQPILSYNFGAENMERVKGTFKLLLKISLIFSLSVVAVIFIFPKMFIGMFTEDPQLLQIGTRGIRIFMAGMAIMGAQSACQQTFLALGQAKISMFLAFLRKIFLLIPLVLILPKICGLGTDGVLMGEAIADTLAAIITTTIFIKRSKTMLAPRIK
ncbi:MAG: MATE family efflux transporter [Anaerovoracaceae bacterium]